MRLFLVFLFLISSKLVQAQFIQSPENFHAVWGGESVFGDLDNDGDLDLVVSGNSDVLNSVSILYRNEGGGDFTEVATLAGVDGGSIDLGDYNQDGLVDILMVGSIENITSSGTLLFNNKGNFLFEKVSHPFPHINWGDVQFADFDNDGDEDVILVGSNITYSYHDVFINNNGVFTALGLNLWKYSDPVISVGDFDLDSDLDYSVVGSGTNTSPSIFRNVGDYSFVPVTIYPNPISEGDIQWGDFNNDSFLDLLLMGHDQTLGVDLLTLMKNNGNGEFTPVTTPFVGLEDGNASWGDMDNDGELDIVVTGREWGDVDAVSTSIYLNNNGNFVKLTSGLPALIFSQFTLGDADNDLDLDVLFSGSDPSSPFVSGRTYLYVNTTASANTKPAAPGSLQSTVDGQRVNLSWGSAIDGQTPSSVLTYSIYVNRLPAQDNSGKTLSDASTGFRKVVQMGNVQHNTSWIVDNLEPGTYYWGVQSIDAGFIGSAFSTEQSFMVQNLPPSVVSLSSLAERVGSSIIIKGKNFFGTTSVKINGTNAVFKIINSTTLKILIPNIIGAGYFEVSNSAGSGISTQPFCVIPEKPVITGSTSVCPGIVSYSVAQIDGVAYNWTVDAGGELVENNNHQIKIKWKSRGSYVVKAIAQTCMAGAETSVIVQVKGPAWNEIFGNMSPETESFEQYRTDETPGESYSWTLSHGGQVLGSSSSSYYTIKWTQPGVHTLQLKTTNAECPTAPIENVIDINVTLNNFSYHSEMTIAAGLEPNFADLDNDGDHDFIVDGNKVFENIMPAGFRQKPSSLPVATSIRYADLNRDNDLDIVISYKNGNYYEIAEIENLGGFNFGPPKKIADKLSTTVAELIDYDNDGDLDILSMGTARISIYERLASNQFQTVEVYSSVEPAKLKGSVEIIDFNRDGRSDVVTSAGGVFLNTGAKSFVLKDIAYPVPTSGGVRWEDFDHDGDLDLVHHLIGNLNLYRNDNNSFTLIFNNTSTTSTQFIDVNGDEWKDLIIKQNPVRVCLYDPATQTFENTTQRFDAWGSSQNNGNTLAGVTDLNQDGNNDLVLHHTVSGVSSLAFYTNNTGNPFSAYFISSPSSAVEGDEAVLSWQGDIRNSYEVIVGTSPGSIDKQTTLGDLATGHRKVLKVGNAEHKTSFNLRGLSAGTYYWSVQAIDNSLRGSPFSPPSSFTVTAPAIEAPDSLRIFSTPTGIALRWNDNSDDEEGFIIERSDDSGNFVVAANVVADVVVFNESISLGARAYYRVKAFNNAGQSLYSEIISTEDLIISAFPYFESFETAGIPWRQWEASEEKVINARPSIDWSKYKFPFFGSVDGSHAMKMENGTSGISYVAVIESPYFDLSNMVNPCLVFDYRDNSEVFSNGEGGLSISGTLDKGQTWRFITGIGGGSDTWFRHQALLTAYKSNISKFRFVGIVPNEQRQIVYFDDIRIVECPTLPVNPQVTQTAPNELLLTWGESINADQYFLLRRENNGSYLPLDTLDAPATSYLDKNVTIGKTYTYRMNAVNYVGPAYSSYVNSSPKYLSRPPVVQAISNQEMKAMTTLSVEAAVTDETSVASLNIVVESSNGLVLPSENITLEKKTNSIVIKITSNTEITGTSRITIRVKDEFYTVESGFDLVIKERNIIPTVVSQKDLYTINEDTFFEISLNHLNVDDADNVPADHVLEISPGANYTISGNKIIPIENFSGTLSVPVTVGDGLDRSQVFPFMLSVSPVNDAPVITGITLPSLIQEDEPIEISLSMLEVSDPDNTFPNDFVLTLAPGANYTYHGNVITPEQDYHGNITVPVTVFDGTSLSNAYELHLTINGINDPPVLLRLTAPLTYLEDEIIRLPLSAFEIEDADHQTSELSIVATAGTHYTISNGNIIPEENFNGTLTVAVRAFDGTSYSGTLEIDIAITAVNDAPVIRHVGVVADVSEDVEFTLPSALFDVYDPDNISSDLSLEILNGINYQTENGFIIPSKDFNGILIIPVKIFDGAAYSEAMEVSVRVIPVNDAPMIISVKALSALEDEPFSIPLELFEVLDPDHTFPIDFSLVMNNGSNFSISNGSVVPDKNFNGSLEIPVRLSDGVDVSDEIFVHIDVVPVNDRPEILGQKDQISIAEDTNVSIDLDDLLTTDVDNTSEDLRVKILSGDHYVFNDNTLTPENNFNGELIVPLVINDGKNDSEIFSIRVHISPVNDIPIITGVTKNYTTIDGSPVAFDLNDFIVLDPDNNFPEHHDLIILEGDNYSVVDNTVVPFEKYSGHLKISVQVSDGEGLSEIYEVSLTAELILGTEEEHTSPISLYPNPNRGKFTLDLPSRSATTRVRILGTRGNVVYENEATEFHNTEIEIVVPAGVYIIEVVSENKKATKKFVVI